MNRAFAVATLCLGCTRAVPPKASADHRQASATAAATTPSPSLPAAAMPAFDDSVDLGAVRLHMRCMGNGEPLVVFESGLGLDGSAWRLVQPEIARSTRACAYDRAGRGLSGPAPYPNDQRRMATHLHALLEQSGHHGPYILVGHSMGGANVRWFLDAHPDDVVGMVLIDAATEDWPDRVLARVPIDAHAEFWRNLRAWEGLEAETYVAGYRDLRNTTSSLGSQPLVILTAGKPESDLPLRLEMHAALKRLSSNTVHIIAKDSSHNIPLESASIVVGSVRAVLHAARTQSQLSQQALSPAE